MSLVPPPNLDPSPERLRVAEGSTKSAPERLRVALDEIRVQRSEERFRELVEGLDAVIWEAEAHTGRVTFMSKRVEDIFGYPVHRWIEDPEFWIEQVHPDDRDWVVSSRRTAVRSGKDYQLEYRVLAADSRVVWLRESVGVVRDEDVVELRGLTIDITDRKLAESRQEAQYEITRVLGESGSLPEAAQGIMRAICETLDWDLGILWAVDMDANRLRCVDVWHVPSLQAGEFEETIRSGVYDPSAGLPGQIRSTGEPVWITDVTGDRGFLRAKVAARAGLHGGFGFPIVHRGTVVGVLEFFSRRVQPRDDELLRMAAAIGVQIGQFIERRWTEEERRLERALLESQNEATIDGILVVTTGGAIASFNHRFVQMWGIPPEVVDSRSDQAAIEAIVGNVVDPDAFLDRIRHLYAHPEEESRDEIRLKDGRVFDRWSAPLRAEDGSLLGRAWYFRDVTDDRREQRALEERERQAAFLATATALLGSSLRYEETLEQLSRLVVPTMADWCAVHVIESGGFLRLVALTCDDTAGAGLAEEIRKRSPDQVDPDASRGLSKVIRTGIPEMAAAIEDEWLVAASRGDQVFLDLLRRMGLSSYMCVPLTARGRVLGVITFIAAESGRSYGPNDFSLAQDLAQRAAFAIDNARLYQERSHIAQTLQKSLLPPSLPEIPGIEIAARYHAAGEGYEVGGDFYDVFYTGRRNWGVIVGDVCGKGPEAAALTALTRYTVRAAAMQSRKPRRVLSVLNEAILRHGQESSFCTAVYARIEIKPDGVRATVGRGGHPAALLLRAGGDLEVLDPYGALLGVMVDPTITDLSIHMGPGDALILYTDGVTEARGPSGIFGEQALRALVSSCRGLSAESVAGRIERTVLDLQESRPRDDIALLVLRVHPQAPDEQAPSERPAD